MLLVFTGLMHQAFLYKLRQKANRADKVILSARIERESSALHIKPDFILHADLHCIRRIYEY